MRFEPGVEFLEGRDAPAVVLPAALTYSFVPDGTKLAGGPSVMDSRHPAWRDAVRRALSAWGWALGLSLTEVPDSGVPAGSSGPQGTIRIGGVESTPTVAGWAYYPGVGFDTRESDVTFNAALDWSQFDLTSVALHELGHAIAGLDHGESPIMSAQYRGQAELTRDDVAAALRRVEAYPNPSAVFSKQGAWK